MHVCMYKLVQACAYMQEPEEDIDFSGILCFTLFPWDRVSHWTWNKAEDLEAPRDTYRPGSHQAFYWHLVTGHLNLDPHGYIDSERLSHFPSPIYAFKRLIKTNRPLIPNVKLNDVLVIYQGLQP